MFKLYTKELDTVPVCGDCGCFITGKVIKCYDTGSFFCVECIEPWVSEEDWQSIIA